MTEGKKNVWVTVFTVVSAAAFVGCYFINPLKKEYNINVAWMIITFAILTILMEIFLSAMKNKNLNYTLRSSLLLIMILLYFIAL